MRADRWEQEKMLIKYEMRWVVNWFEYKKSMWEKWADESEKNEANRSPNICMETSGPLE